MGDHIYHKRMVLPFHVHALYVYLKRIILETFDYNVGTQMVLSLRVHISCVSKQLVCVDIGMHIHRTIQKVQDINVLLLVIRDMFPQDSEFQ